MSPATISAQALAAGIDGSTVVFDEPGDGRIWARGRTYKASFGTEGASYIPFLGSSAPRNFPVTFALAAADADRIGLALDRGAAPQRTGGAIEYRRGSVVERYDLAPECMEQTFWLAQRPPAGDLRLVLDLASELETEIDAGGLHLRSAWGGVDVSTAVAVDARGRRVALAWQSSARGLELCVPHGFLAAAAYPLVIDPLISTFAIENSPVATLHPDVCVVRIESTAIPYYAVTLEQIASATDHDVWTALLDQYGTVIGATAMWTDVTTAYWGSPRIANHPVPGNTLLLVVAAVGVPGVDQRSIQGRLRDPLTQLNPFPISGFESGDKHTPGVGGGDSAFGTNFCVVWERVYSPTDSDIHAQLVDVSGVLLGPRILVNDTTARDMLPDIMPWWGGYSTWTIVWEREYSSTDHDILGALVQENGVILQPTFVIDTSGNDDRRPCVSPQDTLGDYLVVWERDVGPDTDLVGASLSIASVNSIRNLSQLDGSLSGVSQFGADVDQDAQRYVVTYAEPPSSSVLYADVRASTFHVTATHLIALDEGHVTLADSVLDETAPRIACAPTGGYPIRSPAMAVWQATHASGVADVAGAIYELPIIGFTAFCAGDGVGAPPTTPCPCSNWGTTGHGCANSVNPAGAYLEASGTPIADDVVLSGSGMPATVICIYLQGDALDDAVYGDGVRCTGGALLRLRARANVGGASSFPDSTDTVTLSFRGGVTPGSGVTCYYQTYYRNAAAAFCPPATFNVTNGRIILW